MDKTLLKEIRICDIGNVRIGQVENEDAKTGVTVIVAPEGAPTGLDIRGGGPASRESGLMDPLAAAEVVHAVVLGGGSAFGLDAAGGVMQCLAEHEIGFPVGPVRVPLVCQSDIFDLMYGSSDVYPDKKMGYEAASKAFEGEHGNYQDGNHGCGCGATVGKVLGPDRCTKTGIGSYAVQLGDLKVGAIVCTNALGDIYDYQTGARIAGVMNEQGTAPNELSCEELMLGMYANAPTGMAANTTIGIILTNAKLDKTKLCKVAGMGHDGYARCIRPIHTSMDGDSIYAMSLGAVEANTDVVGTIANHVICEAIKRSTK
ncbi:P1 family peptidase [Pseudobutyrivibrio xylanivorans]|uniref:P1 family peptidase n=1 Tax=Pseudobutyrivibrio xylanivorans TaxID=185007 RepID=A0A5P6VS99_PSEXY|nr:P1 family peptidase [Pseudobutyrivibrio xylanivorans]QFJ54589.1 P1 family peptidase [Pseudobutyrivibrio xylanivorans]